MGQNGRKRGQEGREHEGKLGGVNNLDSFPQFRGGLVGVFQFGTQQSLSYGLPVHRAVDEGRRFGGDGRRAAHAHDCSECGLLNEWQHDATCKQGVDLLTPLDAHLL